MALAKGIDSKITIGSTTVAKLNNMTVSHANNSEETKFFQEEGSTFTKTGESLVISCSGNLVGGATGDTGQNLLITAASTATAALSGIKFYEDDSGYWYEADTSSNSASTFMIDSFSIGSQAGSFVTFSADFKCSGDYKRTKTA
jgi:hypothetical protein